MGERRARAQRRRRDRFLLKDLVYLAGMLLIAGSLWVAVGADRRAARADQHAATAIVRVQRGRRVSIAAVCAVDSAISEAGRSLIAGSAGPETPFTRALERLGYPPLARRKKQARIAGQLYVRSVSTRVDRELARVGHRPLPGLVRADGTIDCAVLQRIASLADPR